MEKLIVIFITIITAIIALKFKGVFHKIIAFGLIISFLVTFTGNYYFITISLIALILLSITTFVYGIRTTGLRILDKISIISMGLFLTVSFIFKIMHLPGVGILNFSMIVPIVITFLSFVTSKKLTKEMSFMIFWLAFIVLKFLRIWIY